MKLIQGNDVTESNVEFVGSEMQLTYETTQTLIMLPNFLLDADLAILGKDWETYENYIKQIRKEYSIYPDFLYNLGRKKILIHFLEFEEIFKTEHFKAKYEKIARENIQKEISML